MIYFKQCSKTEQQCFIGSKNTRHPSKSVSFWSPNKGSNCERRTLAYGKNKLYLISMLYIKNSDEECFIRYKAHARDVLSVI